MERFDVVGVGMVGLATADAIRTQRRSVIVAVLQKEHSLAAHQSGRGSCVLRSGSHHAPGIASPTVDRVAS